MLNKEIRYIQALPRVVYLIGLKSIPVNGFFTSSARRQASKKSFQQKKAEGYEESALRQQIAISFFFSI